MQARLRHLRCLRRMPRCLGAGLELGDELRQGGNVVHECGRCGRWDGWCGQCGQRRRRVQLHWQALHQSSYHAVRTQLRRWPEAVGWRWLRGLCGWRRWRWYLRLHLHLHFQRECMGEEQEPF